MLQPCVALHTLLPPSPAPSNLIHATAMLANAARVVGSRVRPFSVRQQQVPINISLQQSRIHRQRPMSAAAGGGAGEQPAGSLEQVSVNELQELLANPVLCEEVQFVDVREPWEYDTAKLPHFKLFPLSQASSWAANIEDQLDPEKETVVLCHHGMRSMQMAGFLMSKDFKLVKNVTGGIAAYSSIDRNVPEY